MIGIELNQVSFFSNLNETLYKENTLFLYYLNDLEYKKQRYTLTHKEAQQVIHRYICTKKSKKILIKQY
jgi:hypothetical protein